MTTERSHPSDRPELCNSYALRKREMDKRRLSTVVIAVMLGAASLAPAGPAMAQQPVEEYAQSKPSEDQVKLNSAAVEAMLAEDYAKAAKLLEASIELGALNVTWLNLGRAYQKLGRCKDARKAYLSVVTSPAVADPPPKLINAKADQYLNELAEQCAAEEGAEVAEGGAEPSGEDSTDATDSASTTESADDRAVDAPVEPAESSNALGWSATIAGGALLVSSGVFYFVGQQEYATVEDAYENGEHTADGAVLDISRQEAIDARDRGDLFTTLSLSTAVAGAALTGLGVYWLVSDDGEQTAVSVGADARGVSVNLSGRF